MDDKDLKQIGELFKHHIGILSEDFQHKLDLVVEGQQMLAERMERMEGRMDSLETKVDRLEVRLDAVATDLTAHRKDTEAHHGVCRVKESRE